MADDRQNRKRRRPDRHENGFLGVPGKHEGGGDYPAFREDFLQHIVDVNWAGKVSLALQALLGTAIAPSFLSADGVKWTDSEIELLDSPPYDTTSTGASGEKFTVVAPVGELAYNRPGGWVVYGEPKDGEPCFIAVTPCGGVYRGVEDEDTTIWTYVCGLRNLPLQEFYGYGYEYNKSDAVICGVSFAGGMFFIGLASYDADFDPPYLACSSDGENWQFVKIFADTQGSDESDIYSNRYSGNVAYNPDSGTYCITGCIFADFLSSGGTRNQVFMWDTSNDGLHWAGGSFDHSAAAAATGMGLNYNMGNVAFGNGLFVAVGTKNNTPSGSSFRGNAAVFTSPDGDTWTTVELPGIPTGADVSSGSRFIAYVARDAGFFFVAGAQTSPLQLSYLWSSTDGIEWAIREASDIPSTDDGSSVYVGASVISDPAGEVLYFPACAGDNHDGAIFVSGDRAAQIRYAKMDNKDSPQEWVPLGDITDTSGFGQILSGAYAKIDGKPTFVFGGNCTRGSDHTTNIGMIMYSHDGLTWTDALLYPLSSVNKMVWDVNDKHFYADVHDFDLGEQPYRSPDGINWTPVTDGTYTQDHYHNFDSTTEDGWYGYDIATDTLIEPYDNTGHVKVTVNACFGPSDITYVATGLGQIAGVSGAVGYAGGIWVVGGYLDNGSTSGTATSTDNGQTWTVVSTGKLGMDWEAGIQVILGAPIEDFS